MTLDRRARRFATPAEIPVGNRAVTPRRTPTATRAATVLGIGAVAGAAAYLAVRRWRNQHGGQSLPVVAEVDLARYAGTWYEQARLPNRFQRHHPRGAQVSAHYSLRADGGLDVLNRSVSPDGQIEMARGVARPMPVRGIKQPGRLAVRFASAWLAWLPPVWGEYWIIQLDEDYQYALVGTPDRRYLWVLSRRPRLQGAQLRELLEYASLLGFPVRRLIRTAV